MRSIAAHLAEQGWVLRTGMATGADQAFYRGACARHGSMELYLPWRDFERGERSDIEGREIFVLAQPTPEAYELAAKFHPNWGKLTDGPRALHARNSHQVLGRDLKTASRFVVCWTEDGSLDGSGNKARGTGQALRIAHHHDIPVFNLALPDHAMRAPEFGMAHSGRSRLPGN
jgi:hypothetical protein